MTDFTVKQGGIGKVYEPELRIDDEPYDLTTATAVTFHLRDGATDVLIRHIPVTIITAAAGLVRVTFQASDLTIARRLKGEFEITLPGAAPRFLPDNGYVTIDVQPNLAGA